MQAGDNLSAILYRLSIRPIWGANGSVSIVTKQNLERIKDRGNLIFPNYVLEIPKELLNGKNCAAVADTERRRLASAVTGGEENDAAYRKICSSLESLAEEQSDNNSKA